jgi:hypothetical protein
MNRLLARCTRYNIKFVSDLRQVGGFLQVLWFPPPLTEILLKVTLNTINHQPRAIQDLRGFYKEHSKFIENS